MEIRQEFKNSLKLTKKAFILLGIDLYDSHRRKYLMGFIYFFNLLWLYTDVIGEIIWLAEGISLGKSLDELSMVAPCSMMCLLATIKVTPLFLNIRTLRIVLNKLEVTHQDYACGNVEHAKKISEERKIVTESIKFLKFVILTFSIICGVVMFMFSCGSLMLMGYEYYRNGIVKLRLPFLIIYFFDAYANYTIWFFAYIHQVWSTVIVVLNIYATDTLLYILCAYLSIHFRILGHHFENVVGPSPEKTRKNLVNCLKRHQDLITLVNQLEILYSKSSLLNITSSSLLICLSGFNITVVKKTDVMVTFGSFLMMSLTQVFFMCYYGDLLMTSSTQIRESVYNCRWYAADAVTKRSVLFTLCRSQKACKLTAAQFADLNLTLFTTILSRSWSWFALLKTMYD